MEFRTYATVGLFRKDDLLPAAQESLKKKNFEVSLKNVTANLSFPAKQALRDCTVALFVHEGERTLIKSRF